MFNTKRIVIIYINIIIIDLIYVMGAAIICQQRALYKRSGKRNHLAAYHLPIKRRLSFGQPTQSTTKWRNTYEPYIT